MDTTRKEKINRFLNDVVMQQAVYDVLLDAFLKPKDRSDIHMLAGSRIAIDLLQEAWKDLQKVKNETQSEKKELKQVGL
jgi:hypothetical protein